MRRLGLLLFCFAPLVFAGCSANFSMPTPDTAALGEVQGRVYGGQQPIVGAHVYVYALNASSHAGASTSLLKSVSGKTTADSNSNYYVTTDASGNFALTGDYTCATGQQVYLLASGGNAGAGANSAISLLAGLGTCPSGGSLASAVPFVNINEVTTVATAYALSGFAIDSTDIGSSSAFDAQSAANNGMALIPQLVDLATGTARTATTNGNGVVPQQMINTLANILAACVNSSGSGSTACTTLMNDLATNYRQNNPATTADAAIALAQANRFTSLDTTGLYNLITNTAPFQPYLSTAPPNFPLRIDYFTGTQLSSDGTAPDQTTTLSMSALAIDEYGYAWVVGRHLHRISPAGALTTYTSTSFINPTSIAVEPQSQVIFIADAPKTYSSSSLSPNTLYTVNGSGTNIGQQAFSPYTSACTSTGCTQIAADGQGNIWSNDTGRQITRVNILGSATAFPIDINGRFLTFATDGSPWITDSINLELRSLSGSNSSVNYSSAFLGDNLSSIVLSQSNNIVSAVDANTGNFVVPGSSFNPISSTFPAGIQYTAANSYTTQVFGTSSSSSQLYLTTVSVNAFTNAWSSLNSGTVGNIAIDAGANVWMIENSGNSIALYVGLANPVRVPFDPANALAIP